MRDDRIKIINRQSREVAVTLPYAQHPVDNPVHIEKLKEIEGHKWNPEQKCWIFPRSNDTIKSLLDIFKGENVWIPAYRRQGPFSTTGGRANLSAGCCA